MPARHLPDRITVLRAPALDHQIDGEVVWGPYAPVSSSPGLATCSGFRQEEGASQPPRRRWHITLPPGVEVRANDRLRVADRHGLVRAPDLFVRLHWERPSHVRVEAEEVD